MNPIILATASAPEPHFTVITAALGAGSFTLMGLAIFATEQMFTNHVRIALASLFALGLVHIMLKTSGAPMWY